MAETIFILIAALTIASAVWVVTSPNIVHSVVALLFTLFGIAGLYVFLYADFIAATQVVIYVGGILVLLIFGVMLTNRIAHPKTADSIRNQLAGALGAGVIFIMLVTVVLKTDWKTGAIQSADTTVEQIGKMLLFEYLLPFEVISVLLLVALIGAALLSRKTDG